MKELKPCKCGSTKTPDLDSDDMIPCWIAQCFDCGQQRHSLTSNWTLDGAINEWNKHN